MALADHGSTAWWPSCAYSLNSHYLDHYIKDARMEERRLLWIILFIVLLILVSFAALTLFEADTTMM